MIDKPPDPEDPAWLPDPDAQWWFRDGPDWRALEDVDAMIALLQRAPETKFARGGETRSRSGPAELFGCWVRPRGATGTGRWMDQEEARRAWNRGEEVWWGSGWVWREGVPEEIPPTPPPPPEPTVWSPAQPPNAFEVDSYTFVRVKVGVKYVWIGPPIESVLTRSGAARKAVALCKGLCCSERQGSHAYNLGDLQGESESFEPNEESHNHIRIASLEEVEAYWASKTNLPKSTWAAKEYRVWVADHAQRAASLTACVCSFKVENGLDRPMPQTPGFTGSCHAHFAVYADLLSPEHDNLHTFAVEK